MLLGVSLFFVQTIFYFCIVYYCILMKITLIFLLSLFSSTLWGENVFADKQYYFKRFDINNGLSQNTVSTILQDRDGFMWFGTKDGLNRYDGVSFKVFKMEPNGLGNNFITALYEDKRGNLWIGTDAGLYIYYSIEGVIKPFDLKSNRGTSIERSVIDIVGDNKDNVWIAVNGQGLFSYDNQSSTLANYIISEGKNATRLFWDGDRCWVGFWNDNLYYSDDCFRTLQPFASDRGEEVFKGDIINKIIRGPYNRLYIGAAKGGLKEISLSTRQVRTLLAKDERGDDIYVREITPCSEGELWVGTESGIFIYNLKLGESIHLTNKHSDPYSLADNAIYALYKDREGGLWIGSYFGGVSYYPQQHTYFEKVYPQTGRYGELGKRVRELCRGKDGTIWIGTEDKGLFSYNAKTKEIKPFTHPLIYHNIHGLCIEDNYLWVGTFSGGLNRIDLSTHAVKNYKKGDAEGALNSNDIFAIYKTMGGELWLGTPLGALRYDSKKDCFSSIPELAGVFVYGILEDSEGNLWFATYSEGVYCFQVRDKQWKHYQSNKDIPGSLPYDKVLSIYEDSRKQLWFTTEGQGFCRFDAATETFISYNSPDVLPNNVVHQIVEDDKGLFWITTNKGLVRFDPKTEKSKVFTTANGLLSNQFNYRSGYKDEKGNIYLGSTNGLVIFNPNLFTGNKFIPPVLITDFRLFNKELLPGEISPLKCNITHSDKISLKADQNSFSFNIAALSYQASEMNQLQYQLQGYDKEWHLASPASAITYSNLPYGSYTFQVKGANNDGLWNEHSASLQIEILPPFYLSMWAFGVYGLLFCSLVYWLLFSWQRRNQRRQAWLMAEMEQRKEKELYAAKIDFFTNVAHEIRTPLTLIKCPLDNVLNEQGLSSHIREDLKIMSQNTDRLLNLTNQLLDFRKTEAKGFNLTFVERNISEIIKECYVRFTALAKQKSIGFTLNMPEADVYASVDKEAVTKIISNLFTNAIKYAATYIQVSLSCDATRGTLSITVTNDGEVVPVEMRENIFKPFVQYKGKEKNVVGTGIGLALSRSLTELHHGKLVMEDSVEYNCFCLSLPLRQENTIFLNDSAAAPHERADAVTDPQESFQKKYSLLVVEDNMEMQSFLVRQLGTLYHVLKAGNGMEALDILNNQTVHLIISDIMMPVMDGIEFCNRVKNDLNYSHIPIILLTAKTNLQSKIEGIKSGADAYIEKPFSVEYLKVNITTLLENREKLRRTFIDSPFVLSDTVALTKADEAFLKRLNEVVIANMKEPEFCLDDMASMLNMSRSSLNRKIKGLLELTPNDYIRLERLKKAAQLLKEGECKINEVCYMVGFNTPSYFAKCFQKQFGVLPKDFVRHREE